ncbi:LCP family protein [Mycobacterium sp. 155]|uniref:LCP family protein n=1 Tax=Mycobacterium sp. 155 TaxID=1157943 RepID=UPI00039D9703|nr:LCP family protein [Mycobacterium sp. 155]
MSDGDNATPGHRRHAQDADDSQWLTRSPLSFPGAAPWERADHVADANPAPAEPTGSHVDGVTVADLIARMSRTDDVPAPRRSRHRAVPDDAVITDPAYAEDPAYDPSPNRGDITDTAARPAAPDDHPRSPAPTHRFLRAGHVPPARAVGRPIDRDPLTEIIEPVPANHHRVKLAGRVVAALLAVLALVLTGGAWQWQSSKNNMLNKVSALDPNSRDILDPNAQFGDENFLIVGIDSRFGANAQMGAGDTEAADGARSDTIMLVNIPASRKRVVAVSFPRDLAITPIKCEPWNPETSTYGPIYDKDTGTYGPDEVYTETKINSAFAFGGPKCLVKVIQKLSGLSINRFMAVDFAGFSKMVDALGGVEVCSTTPLEDYELGTVLANAGRQTVDGHTALNYVRARQVTTEFNGDYGRIKRQQLFLSSLLRSLISKDTFFSLSKLNNVVNMFIADSYVDNIKTKDLVDLGQSVQGVNAGRISFVTVPTVGYADESGNETPRTDDMRALFDAIINDDPLPGEKNPDNTPVPGSTPSSTSAAQSSETPQTEAPAPATDPTPAELVNAVTTDPQDVTVRVSNSTGADGLAATAAEELQQHGFNVSSPDDYPEALSATTVFFSPGNEQAAATVASSFSNPTIERVSGMGSVVRVVLGSDFHNVNAPTPSGSEVQVNVVHGTSTVHTELPPDLTVTNAADTTCE